MTPTLNHLRQEPGLLCTPCMNTRMYGSDDTDDDTSIDAGDDTSDDTGEECY